MDFKIIQSMLERVQICRRCWKTKECAGAGGTAQDQQGTHEQLSQNRKTVVDHPGNDTQYYDLRVCKLLNGVIFTNSVIILSCGVYVNICYVK